MKKWYSDILKDLRKLGNKIFVVDQLGLLNEKNLLKEIRSKFKIHEYKDDGSLYLFFNKNKEKKILIISSKVIQRDFIGKSFQIMKLSLSKIFPELNINIIKDVDISYYQTLYNDYTERKSQGLILPSTEDFVLKSIWDIDIGKLHSNTENLKIALSYIVDKKDVPEIIINKISKKLSININELRNNHSEFIFWIKILLKEYVIEKERNEILVYDLANPVIQFYLIKISMNYDINLPIPSNLISNENWLSKFKKEPNQQEIKESITTLVFFYRKMMDELLKKEFDLNEIDDMLKLSRMFCEIIYLIQINEFHFDDFIKLEKEYDDFDKLFREKLVNERNNNYESLFYSSTSDNPLTVDKILDFAKSKFKTKIALIVMDGMSFDEWFILKDEIKDFKIIEREIFSIIPTITSFSRTAIFSGKIPKDFMNEKYQVNEEKEFFSAMEGLGFNKNNVIYGNLNLKSNTLKTNKNEINLEHLKGYDFMGIVCNLFDDLSHDKVITNARKSIFYKNIKNNINSSSLIKFFQQLKKDGYHILITADHGNVFCEGNGISPNKNLEIDNRSSRCLFFDNENFAEKVTNANFSNTFSYKYSMLPSQLTLVLPITNQCFIKKEDYRITHGGISPEELIVPLVILE
jgi:hypothetical protein